MVRKDLNVKKMNKAIRKELRSEQLKLVEDLRDSDLDNESYMDELDKIKKLDDILGDDKKSKMDGQTKAAIVKGVFSLIAIAGIIVYENREVIHSKLGMNMATRGI